MSPLLLIPLLLPAARAAAPSAELRGQGGAGGAAAPVELAARELPSLELLLPDGAVVRAELAATPRDQARGLMHRTSLEEGRGMLFVFPGTERRSFWMKNTLIDLDMVFLDADRRIVEVFADVPRSTLQTPESELAVRTAVARFVLELPAGSAARHALAPGQALRFELPPLPPPPPSFDEARQEARRLLELLARGPGGAGRLAAAFRREGLPARVVELGGGLSAVVARLEPSTRTARAPLLLAGSYEAPVSSSAVRVEGPFAFGPGAAGGLGRAAAQAAAVLLLRRADRRLERAVVFAAAEGGSEGLRRLLASGAAGTASEAVTGGGRTELTERGFGRVELEVRVSSGAVRPGGPFFAASASGEFWEELGAAPREVPAASAEVLELGRALGAAAGLDLPLTEEEWAARGTPRERVVEGALAWLAYALNRWLDEEAGAPWRAASGAADAPRPPGPDGAQPSR